MLFLSLETDLGSATIEDGIVVLMELARLPYKEGDARSERVHWRIPAVGRAAAG